MKPISKMNKKEIQIEVERLLDEARIYYPPRQNEAERAIVAIALTNYAKVFAVGGTDF